MTDDLFERLRAGRPRPRSGIAQERACARAATPGRIVETEPTNVRRFPKAARRNATLAASPRSWSSRSPSRLRSSVPS